MATVTPTYNNDLGKSDGSIVSFTWAITTANSDGAPFKWPEWADICFTATGTWGAATLSLEGSNDNATWLPLSNAAGGTAATASANKAMTIIERPLYIRPNLTVVGVGAILTVIAACRRAQPLRV